MQTRTFLFADLRDYTRFVEDHGDAAARTLIADYRTLVRAEVARHDGAEVKTEGDSFYVVFNSARQALACGMSILREAERYSRLRPDRPMRVGVGIHAGEPEPHEGQYVGKAVIVAARLAQTAAAGELLVTDVVRALIPRGAAPAMDERAVTLKGIDDPPRVHSVSWQQSPERPAEAGPAADAAATVEASPPQGQQVLCPEIIGRDRELETLEALLEDASGRRGRVALIGGEAGLGKSALLRRFLDRARAKGALALVGECSEVEARRPFGPVIDAFVAAAIPLPEALRQGGPGAQPVAESETYRVHAGFAAALEEAARERTCVLTVEDIHWADPATLELVPYLARKLRGARALIVVTYRTDELHRRHPLNHLLAELARGRLGTEVRLRPLSEDETAAVIKAALGLTRAPTTAFRRAIQERCGGNPFFVEEVLAALVERGDLTYRAGSWQRSKEVHEIAIPVSVRDAVEQRLHALTQRALRTVHVASVIGQRFEFELLRAVTEMSEQDLLEALREAVAAQLVIEERSSEETYRFRHALTREAVLEELMARERRILHRRIGEAIEATGGADGRAEDLAYHFDEARDTERARRYHELAAERAEHAFAHTAALAHRERAVELMADDDGDLPSAQVRLARAALAASEIGRAARAAEEARRGFEAAGDVSAAVSATLLLAYARGSMADVATERALTAEVITALEPRGPSVELARAYALRSRRAMLDRDPDAVDLGRAAVALAERVGDVESRIRAMINLGSAMRNDEGIALLREAGDLAERSGLAVLTAISQNNVIVNLMESGASADELDRAREGFLAYAQRHGFRGSTIALARVVPAFQQGDWDRALAAVEEERDESVYFLFVELVEVLMRTAREGSAALSAIAKPRARLLASGEPQSIGGATIPALTYLLAGDPRSALQHAEPAAGLSSEGPGSRMGRVAAMLSALRLGDRDAVTRWAGIGAAAVTSTRGRDPAQATRTVAVALSSWLRGEEEATLDALDRAARLFQEDRAGVLAAVVREARARMLTALGRRDAARAELDEALAFWRTAKATWYIGELERWAAENGVRQPAAGASR